MQGAAESLWALYYAVDTTHVSNGRSIVVG